MRKYLFLLLFILLVGFFLPENAHAAENPASTSSIKLLAQGGGINTGTTVVASDGAWLTDPDVTFAGKTASRAASLFNWVLVNYKWSYGDNTLATFWVKIRNIVYAFLVLIVIITAFTMIITGGQSITAVQFLRKFLVVLFLITLSFAIIRFFYQIVDIITGFFVRNPDGDIISSRDLFNMSFGYDNFLGWRKYGPEFDESAFVSLLLVKITAVTYYVMAGILIVRKIILWFFITVSPIYPILLLYFPIRNTAKIWLGEFFRWLLYAPLFTIFLSGLVYLYRDDINVLPFNFYPGGTKPVVYPTAINILLGGPGQKLDISNSVNYTDTFAEYVIALIMVWVVIFLPFLLLRIFLDYLSNISINKDMAIGYINNALGYMINRERLTINNPTGPGTSRTPPPIISPTGAAKQIPFSAGSAKEIGYGQNISTSNASARTTYNTTNNYTSRTQNITTNQSTRNTYNRPVARLKSERTSTETLRLTNLPVPTMRDIARYETSRLSSQSTTHQEVSRMHEVLSKIANPYAISSSADREHFTTVREKLFQAKLKGDQVASSILNAASNISVTNQQTNTTTSNRVQTTNYQKNLHETLQKLSNPSIISNAIEKQQFTTIKEQLVQESKQGNILATSILNASHINNSVNATNNVSVDKSLHQTLEKIANPDSLPTTEEKQKFTKLKEKLVKDSNDGNPVAKSVLNSVNAIAEEKKSQAAGKAPAITLPAVNQVQTVNLDDYENVKKMWTENYHKIAVPKTIDKPNRTREQWIKDDLGTINRTISLLISADQRKVNEGMKMVSNILPFLLMGGFSQTEVIAYLKAKEVAGEAVLKDLETKAAQEAENETLISISKRSHRHAALHQTMETRINEGDGTSYSSLPDEDEDMESDLGNLQANIQRLKAQNEQIHQALQLMNLTIPTMRDIAQYESTKLFTNAPKQNEVQTVHTILDKLATPEKIVSAEERDRFMKIREQLMLEKEKGDQVAGAILTASTQINNNQTTNYIDSPIHDTFVKLANPGSIADEKERQQYILAKNTLIQQSDQGDSISSTILNTINNISTNTQNTSVQHAFNQVIEKLANPNSVMDQEEKEQYITTKERMEKEAAEGNPLATAIISATKKVTPEKQKQVTALPKENQVQTVNLDDYENVKKMWIQNYRKASPPKSLDKPNRTKAEWITDDLTKIKQAISLLISNDSEKVKQGMDLVSGILPFLLIGGFSQAEVVAYLKAKEVGAETVLQELEQQKENDETLLEVNRKKTQETETVQHAEIDDKVNKVGIVDLDTKEATPSIETQTFEKDQQNESKPELSEESQISSSDSSENSSVADSQNTNTEPSIANENPSSEQSSLKSDEPTDNKTA